jgi:hypothetical protein
MVGIGNCYLVACTHAGSPSCSAAAHAGDCSGHDCARDCRCRGHQRQAPAAAPEPPAAGRLAHATAAGICLPATSPVRPDIVRAGPRPAAVARGRGVRWRADRGVVRIQAGRQCRRIAKASGGTGRSPRRAAHRLAWTHRSRRCHRSRRRGWVSRRRVRPGVCAMRWRLPERRRCPIQLPGLDRHRSWPPGGNTTALSKMITRNVSTTA